MLHNELVTTEPLIVMPSTKLIALAENKLSSYLDEENRDPATAVASLTTVFPSVDAGTHIFSAKTNQFQIMDVDDVWFIPIYINGDDITNDINITFKVRQDDNPLKYRFVNFNNHSLRLGWQVLCVKHTETVMPLNQNNIINTSSEAESNLSWQSVGGFSDTAGVNNIEIQLHECKGLQVSIGSIAKAPKGWCKSVVMIGVDDVNKSFLTLAVPIVESFGWNMTFFATATYGNSSTRIKTSDYKILIKGGHEVWGHATEHEVLKTPFDEIDKEAYRKFKDTQLRESAKFWSAHGISTASRCMAFPKNQQDTESRQSLADNNYQLARTARGRFNQAWLPGLGKYNLPSFNYEKSHSWVMDSELKGLLLRGQSCIFYGHTPIVGGIGINTNPAPNQFYLDHFTRWLTFLKAEETLGNVIITTPSDYYRMCGINMDTHNFVL